MPTDPSDGVAPGWRFIIDAADPSGPEVIVDSAELRVIQYQYLMPRVPNDEGILFACLERAHSFIIGKGSVPIPNLEFNLQGWTTTYDDAATWLAGEMPDLFIREKLHGAT